MATSNKFLYVLAIIPFLAFAALVGFISVESETNDSIMWNYATSFENKNFNEMVAYIHSVPVENVKSGTNKVPEDGYETSNVFFEIENTGSGLTKKIQGYYPEYLIHKIFYEFGNKKCLDKAVSVGFGDVDVEMPSFIKCNGAILYRIDTQSLSEIEK